MSLNFRHLQISPDVLSQTVANEAVLLDLRSEKYFGLNSVGLRVWELLQQDGDAVAIRDQLLKEFEVSAATLEQDLNEVLARLLAAGLIQERRP
jgi:hypothetical protein